MRKKREVEEVEEIEQVEELSEKEVKKLKRKESVEKRKNAKKKDKIARWGGLILLGLVMFVGFLLLVSGQMKSETKSLNQNYNSPYESGTSSVILK